MPAANGKTGEALLVALHAAQGGKIVLYASSFGDVIMLPAKTYHGMEGALEAMLGAFGDKAALSSEYLAVLRARRAIKKANEGCK